jgi:hypothetical protein
MMLHAHFNPVQHHLYRYARARGLNICWLGLALLAEQIFRFAGQPAFSCSALGLKVDSSGVPLVKVGYQAVGGSASP